MIRKIAKLRNYGSYNDYDWERTLGNREKFKRLNIFYGRNYSGKTLLSRLFRALETKSLSTDYQNSEFSIKTDNDIISNENFSENDLDIRVFNKDYVKDNLRFLIDDESEINSFAIVGEENIKIEDEIRAKQKQLGNISKKSGLLYEIEKKIKNGDSLKTSYDKKSSAFEKKLSDKANMEIKDNKLYGHSRYFVTNLKDDIKLIKEQNIKILSEEEVYRKQSSLSEIPLPNIPEFLIINNKWYQLLEESRQLLQQKLSIDKPISELIDNNELENWVRQGIGLHDKKRNQCAFCGTPLDDLIWKRLKSHFTHERTIFNEEIDKMIDKLKSEKAKFIDNYRDIDNKVYSEFKTQYGQSKEKLNDVINKCFDDIDLILIKLEDRKQNITQPIVINISNDNTEEINEKILTCIKILNKNNEYTNDLEKEQKNNQLDLRLNDVNKFINAIDYFETKSMLENEEKEIKNYETQISIIQSDISSLQDEITILRSKLVDESNAADKITEYLKQCFGNLHLTIEAIKDEETKSYKFEVRRGKNKANNLSEGECSLIAFCYFIARLQDANTAGKKPIIFIDDPVSSLDDNHIFFLYSLIESKIAKSLINEGGIDEYRYEQLFISTHNLEFLKYLKRLSTPSNNNGGYSYFLIERFNLNSEIRPMPSYLSRYFTEYNYLFENLLTCAIEPRPEIIHLNYSFPNILRRFLEIFLFFKYPCKLGKNETYDKLERFFNNDTIKITEVYNMMQVFSHANSPERSMIPVDVKEMHIVANLVINQLIQKDFDQFEALCKSVNKEDKISLFEDNK